MKKFFFIFFLLTYALSATAKHIAGGELFYRYLGPGNTPNSGSYEITLRLFRECTSDGPLLENEVVNTGLYDLVTNVLIKSIPMPIQGGIVTLNLNTADIPCLTGSPNVCYQMAIYQATVDITFNANGYLLSRTGGNRTANIVNVSGSSSSTGATYTTQIPGTNVLPSGEFNSSPQFLVKDTTLVCAKKKFTLDFGASDVDHDSLSYSFCDSYSGMRTDAGALTSPYTSLLSYQFPYSGGSPLGDKVTINSKTGIISGIAPGEGRYVVNVCIQEWRHGKLINQHRKDFILRVQACDLIEADLPDKIVNCNDFTVHFEDQSSSSSIISYLWTITGGNTIVSTDPTVDYTFPDTGRYVVSLTVNGPNGCVGNASAPVYIYPGFYPGFGVVGDCYAKPFTFTDSTTAKYGYINSWAWAFSDKFISTGADTSSQQNPSYQYSQPQNTTAILIVGSSKGCVDTVQHDIAVLGKPLIQLPFRDTLICSIDSVPLIANSSGSSSWTPNYNIINPNTSKPIVYPKDTTVYIVTVTQNGCTNTDSIKVNVLDYITVKVGLDTGICRTDTFRLHPVSYALSYHWTPATGLDDPNTKYPLAKPLSTIRYYVTANLGKCQDHDSILVKVTPYPQSNAGPDTAVCFGDRAQLHASIVASSFVWRPANTLLNPNTLFPVAGPSKTTQYILTVADTLGCSKLVNDTIMVRVIQPIHVFAGRDTFIVANQPLQLAASTTEEEVVTYTWTPAFGLNNPSISNPIVTLGSGTDSVKYTVRATVAEGCYGVDDIIVRVFKASPEIFVPSAFTPNGDGKNDIVKSIPTGITKFQYFRIYNRFGQMLFSSSDPLKGWDGNFGGTQQPSGTYVYTAQGIDYMGKTISRKGTVVLIR